jgi:hypothetical protein
VRSNLLCICPSVFNRICPRESSTSPYQSSRTSRANPRSHSSVHFLVLATSFQIFGHSLSRIDKACCHGNEARPAC